ncbi:two-component system activity regulator YycH [Domibacillus sp. DTU_2020_1001157_1_SI_ALB_TIR_016]|uniref:YycH family regulatory protein n=1 Tax=Domibacillus sp. DTU_2020_1001157_1_SI_ALB_TIR_016 TaxID=3077789 RepID=UPI0028EE8EE1|nr:two-component system activity regulator YycH [Domibacillus sp. DTU_2020_1001157_1_SI_ALB_TIR_016]WNS80873.1 two-component system activity regulator YycH [Domibacillus sp. DTU_2020_1001157_1_SI_ALB_TIR_016]
MNYEKIKSAALALLVLISLAFTWGIWNYQPSYQTIADSADENIVTEVEIGEERKLSDLLKPSRLISHQEGSHYGTIAKQDLDWVMKEMREWTFMEPENISNSLSEAEFSKLLSSNSHVELFFSSPIPFNTFKTMVSFNDKTVPNAVFNRIVITEAEQKNKAFVYFVSVKERLVFKSEVQTGSLREFKQRYVENHDRLEPYISYQVPDGARLYVRKEPPVLTVQSYLPEQIDADTFKRALFNDPSYVQRSSSGAGEGYTTDGTSFMRINSSTGTVRYVNPSVVTEPVPLDQLIEKSIDFVNEHHGWVDSYRLFQTKPGSTEISYRLFLGDFPVFSPQGMASMTELSQIWGRERIYQYDRSSFIVELDKPFPSGTGTVELKSGQEALNEVLKLETVNPKLLTDMRIGYEMTVKQESPKVVVAFEPFWYYQYNGTWQKLVTDEGGRLDGLE